jgi:hypothetical protein
LPRGIGPFCTVVQFGTATPGGIGSACANAPPDADNIAIKVVPARIFFRTPRSPTKWLIPHPQKTKNRRNRGATMKKL